MSCRWTRSFQFVKISGEGYWRTLPPEWKGKDQSGAPISGKTWVRKKTKNMKKWFKPYEHQKEFIEIATSMKKGEGVIAAHGTGTGKTVSAVAAFEELKGKGKASRALVVAPAGLRDNFLKKGVQKFTDSKGMIVKNPNQPVPDDVDYVITSYAAFRQNPDKFLQAYLPDTLIADEMHKATNRSSQTFKSLKSARTKVDRFMGLTASVVQNKPSDISPMVDIATGGKAAKRLINQAAFKGRYQDKVLAKDKGVYGGKVYEQRLKRKGELGHLIGGSVHYIEDLDADKKPTKTVSTIKVPMSPDQMNVYRMSMKGIDPKVRAKIAMGEPVSQKQAMFIFTRLLRARQVSNSLHTHVPNISLEQAAERTPKIRKVLDDAVDHIKGTPDAQIIMYTNLVHGGVDVLEAGLKKRGITFGIFVGKSRKGVTEKTRQKAVEDYTSGKIKVILITGAGAEGLDLGNTTMVQMVDGHFNPERIAQAEARGVRAGGLSHRPKEKRKVRVRRYVSTVPHSFWNKITFGRYDKPEKSVGEWVYSTARRKARSTREVRDVLRKIKRPKKKPTPTGGLFS